MNVSPQRFTVVFTALLCIAGLGSPAAAQSRRKLDRALRDPSVRTSVQRVIIQIRPGASVSVRRLLEQRGNVVESEHPTLDAMTVAMKGADLAALEADPSVLAVSIDAEVTSFGSFKPRSRSHLNRSRNRETTAPAVDLLRQTVGVSGLPLNGAGINVAVVDSGIEPIDDLADRIGGFWDFTRGGIATRPRDDYGHGTHVAGLIASSGIESNNEFAGVAPGVRLYGFRVLDKTGRGRASDVVKALEFIVAARKSGALRIDIINLSLGHPIFEPATTDPLVRAVENAVRAGIVVVTAAGNIGAAKDGDAGYAGVTSPGNAPSAITVGAVDTKGTATVSDDRVASFSSRGPTWYDGFLKPDVVTAGVGLTSDTPRYSSLLTTYPELKKSAKKGLGSFGRLSGTSMASAVASGLSAVVLQASRTANPFARPLSPNALKAVLQYTALPLRDGNGAAYDPLSQGTGGINVRGAVLMAASINTSIAVGKPWLRFPLDPVTSVAGSPVAWAKALTWDDNIVWGTDALSFNSAQFSDNIVWGTALGADNIVWGTAADIDNIVWGTAAEWAASLVWSDRLVGLMSHDNIVWGTWDGLTQDNIVWGTFNGDNIVWGTWKDDNIVWGTAAVDNIVWGTAVAVDNIVWGTAADIDNIVWGTGIVAGSGR